jgi:hypothetical protein
MKLLRSQLDFAVRGLLIAGVCLVIVLSFGTKAEALYSQGSYYSQGTYYSQGYYQSGYYSQGYYQGSYYSQGYYQSAYVLNITDTVSVSGGTSVTGALSKGSGTFVIDHPLDPVNWLLYHSFVESPDVKNMYDGVVTLDENGEATIVLPRYFLALNKEFRYLLTPIGGPMPNLFVSDEVGKSWLWSSITFGISGGAPGGRVSWQVTGIRHDPLIEKNPIIPEVPKGPDALVPVGECLFKPLCL